ncbi:MAG: hypothetical protein ICV55_11870 [Coleofasciculus sp. C3-bin4]|nr:hypothetical protein [Coleofasciculus sp. C3-bin4]
MTIRLKFTRSDLYYKCSMSDEACQTVKFVARRSLSLRQVRQAGTDP